MDYQLKGNVYTIYLKNKAFLPKVFDIKVNDIITFCNMDNVESCIFSPSFSVFPNVYIPANDQFIFTFTKAGRYELCVKDYTRNKVMIYKQYFK